MLQIRVRHSENETASAVERIAASTGLGSLAASILIRRGYDSEEKAKDFIDSNKFYDPFLLNGMEQAVDLIGQAIRERWPITIYGDYDCDGTSACAILYTAFKNAGVDADVYIPDRRTEGYGLNEKAIRKIALHGGLLVTVDCGITNLKEVDLAQNLGLRMIVTDHHQPLDDAPACICINPPKCESYPCTFLCGAGIALKLVHALWGEQTMLSFVDLAAIATIADLVPILDENRTIVKIGLQNLTQSKRSGLKALIDVCGYKKAPLTAGQVAFGLAPRINAAGRMGNAKRSFTLFTTGDEDEAVRLANELDLENQQRQMQEQQILQETIDLLKTDINDRRSIVVSKTGWHPGVIGIVASRLVELYGRPSAVATISEEGICTGSARGIKGVNIFSALDDCKQFLSRYGGHEMAGGFSLKLGDLNSFTQAFENHFRIYYPASTFTRSIECDLSALPSQITLDLANDIAKLAPFGIGNPTPTLLMPRARLVEKRKLGETDDHLRLILEKDGCKTEGLLFRAKQFNLPRVASVCDFVGTLETDSFGGTERAKYLISALRLDIKHICDIAKNMGGLFGYCFARCCPQMTKTITFLQADKCIQRSPFGLMLHVHTPKLLVKALEHWNDNDGLALLEVYIEGLQGHVHGRNALIIAPNSFQDHSYRYIFRLETDEELTEYAKTLFYERDVMANLYRQLIKQAQKPMDISERCLRVADDMGIQPDSVGAAIAVFEDLSFFKIEQMILQPQEIACKRMLEDSIVYNALRESAKGGESWSIKNL